MEAYEIKSISLNSLIWIFWHDSFLILFTAHWKLNGLVFSSIKLSIKFLIMDLINKCIHQFVPLNTNGSFVICQFRNPVIEVNQLQIDVKHCCGSFFSSSWRSNVDTWYSARDVKSAARSQLKIVSPRGVTLVIDAQVSVPINACILYTDILFILSALYEKNVSSQPN